MCLVSSPSAPAAPPPPQYLHNPFLDGMTMGNGLQRGRNSLRNTLPSDVSPGLTMPSQRIATQTAPVMRSPAAPQAPTSIAQPGTVVPTVGGAMAGLLGGRVVSPTGPPAGLMRGVMMK